VNAARSAVAVGRRRAMRDVDPALASERGGMGRNLRMRLRAGRHENTPRLAETSRVVVPIALQAHDNSVRDPLAACLRRAISCP